MTYRDTVDQINDYRKQIAELRAKMRETQGSIEPEEVEDYEFSTLNGPVKLSGLFNGLDQLFVIHNMGASCPYCTLWADGFNGVYEHLANRAAFVVSSPDSPEAQKKFAAGRNWRFPMVSYVDTTFATDMGYGDADAQWMPGVSVFTRQEDKILRVSDAMFGPGDDYCFVWHFLDLLPKGPDGWQPAEDS